MATEFKKNPRTVYMQLTVSAFFGLFGVASIGNTIPLYAILSIAIFLGGAIDAIGSLIVPILIFDNDRFSYKSEIFLAKKQFAWSDIKGINRATEKRIVLSVKDQNDFTIYLNSFDYNDCKEIRELIEARVGLIDSMKSN